MINLSIFYIILAGIINASFVVPTKFIKSFSYEKSWFYHSIFGLMILPWILLLLYTPSAIFHYSSLSADILWFIIFGGLIFGIGQSCFSYSIKYIGIARSFAVNLGIGSTLGSLAVILMNHALFTQKGLLTCIAVFLVIMGLALYYFAEPAKLTEEEKSVGFAHYKGWILSSIAGIASGLQNVVFVYVAFHTPAKQIMQNSFWVWPLFLFAAGIPMSIQFWRALKKNPQENILFSSKLIKDSMLIAVMGLCFSGSLVVYSYAMSLLSDKGQVIGWPLLMISIILSTQFLGKLFDGDHANSLRGKYFRITSVILLIVSVILLSV